MYVRKYFIFLIALLPAPISFSSKTIQVSIFAGTFDWFLEKKLNAAYYKPFNLKLNPPL